jgi:hypothetical protein
VKVKNKEERDATHQQAKHELEPQHHPKPTPSNPTNRKRKKVQQANHQGKHHHDTAQGTNVKKSNKPATPDPLQTTPTSKTTNQQRNPAPTATPR